MSEGKVFRLKEDYVIPAGTKFEEHEKITFTGNDNDSYSLIVSNGWQGFTMVTDTQWMDLQPELFEVVN